MTAETARNLLLAIAGALGQRAADPHTYPLDRETFAEARALVEQACGKLAEVEVEVEVED